MTARPPTTPPTMAPIGGLLLSEVDTAGEDDVAGMELVEVGRGLEVAFVVGKDEFVTIR
jgi:hypothetical protein